MLLTSSTRPGNRACKLAAVNRTKRVGIRMTEEEFEELTRLASRVPYRDVATYVRELIAADAAKVAQEKSGKPSKSGKS